MNRPSRSTTFWLNASIIAARLEERHLPHRAFADALGVSRSYWSQLLNRKRALSPQVRQWLLASPALEGLTEAQLWERVPIARAA
jgi:transcriptional regulator with XRE-family HTH domain